MPKRLSDVTHQYERTTADLEDAQDALTRATESARVKVDAAAQARHRAYDDLYRYVRDNPDVVIVAGDWAYRYERSQIARMRVIWAHHLWVDDPTPAPSYRVPSADSPVLWNDTPHDQPCDPLEMSPAAEKKLTAMVTAWGNVESDPPPGTLGSPDWIDVDGDPPPEPEDDSEEDEIDAAMDKLRAEWEEPNGQPVTIED